MLVAGGSVLQQAGLKGEIVLWNTSDWSEAMRHEVKGTPLHVTFSGDGKTLSVTNRVRDQKKSGFFSVNTVQFLSMLGQENRPTLDVGASIKKTQFLKDRFLIVMTYSKELKVYDIASKEKDTVVYSLGSVINYTLSENERWLVVSHAGNVMSVIDTKSWQTFGGFVAEELSDCHLAMTPDNRKLILGFSRSSTQNTDQQGGWIQIWSITLP
jgi:hypothetical protein